MNLANRILSGLRTVVLIEERVSRLDASVTTLSDTMQGKLANHESRLTRIETMIEIVRPDVSLLRIASPEQVPGTGSPAAPEEKG